MESIEKRQSDISNSLTLPKKLNFQESEIKNVNENGNVNK